MSQTTLDFTAYIAERTRDFTGREWVFADIDQWLADPDAPRYFIITGEPGIGKTAIAARLTQIRDLAAVHFCIARRADTIDPLNFARSLSHQLTSLDGFAQSILKHSNINLHARQNIREVYGQAINVKIENLIVNAPSATVAFAYTVGEPLKVLYASGFDRQLAILVDALDEAVQQQGLETIVDLLANTRGFPWQVHFVLTTRNEADVLRHFEHVPCLFLDADHPKNRADVDDYVSRRVSNDERINTAVAEAGLSTDEFARLVQQASAGNFLYVVWLLRAVVEGTQRLDDLSSLPVGLDDIYHRYLNVRISSLKEWRNWATPLLQILLTAREPVTDTQLERIAGVEASIVWDALLRLRQFLDPVLVERGRYQIYHQSVVDFLANKAMAREYWCDVRAGHKRVAEYYLDSAHWEEDDGYAFRHLATHLAASERDTGLWHLLVETPRWSKAQRLYDSSLRQYARDVEVAISLSEQGGIDQLPRVVAYSLLYSTVRSLATNLPSEVLGLMTSLGQAEQALRFAELMTHPWEQSQAYVKIGEQLLANGAVDQCVEVLTLALQAAKQISHNGTRARALSDVDLVLDRANRKEMARETLSDALMSVSEAKDKDDFVEDLNHIAETMTAISDLEGLSCVVSVALQCSFKELVRAICHLAPVLAKAGDHAQLTRLSKAAESRWLDRQAIALAWVAFAFALVGDKEAAGRLVAQAHSVEKDDPYAGRTEMDVGIIAAMAHSGNIEDALIKADERLIDGSVRRGQALNEVVKALVSKGDLETAWTVAGKIWFHCYRAEALSYIAKASARLGQPEDARNALNAALAEVDQYTEHVGDRVKALRIVAEAMAEVGYTKGLADALVVAERTEHDYGRTLALAQIAQLLVHTGNEERAHRVLPVLL